MSPPIPADSEARVPATRETADAAAGDAVGAVSTPPTPQMEGAAAEEGDAAMTTPPPPPPPPPTCPVCMEPWTCNGHHRICCIPCGHVYGRSCLERWLRRCGDDGAKCPQCGEPFERKLITNLYGPGNLWDGCCRLQELQTHYEREMDRRSKWIVAEYKATMESEIDKWTVKLVNDVSTLVAEGFSTSVAELEEQYAKKLGEYQNKSRAERDRLMRMWKEEKATANANLTAMKERMKKMSEEENATATELIEFMELSFPQLLPISVPHASGSAPPPAPVDSQSNTRRRWSRADNLRPLPAPPGPADAVSKRRRRGT